VTVEAAVAELLALLVQEIVRDDSDPRMRTQGVEELGRAFDRAPCAEVGLPVGCGRGG
jgi:hypothetical protein